MIYSYDRRYAKGFSPAVSDLIWHRMRFTKADLAALAVDPDFVVFEADYEGYVIRVEYEGEVGPATMYWKHGYESQAEIEGLRWGHDWKRGRRGPVTHIPSNLEWAAQQAIDAFVRKSGVAKTPAFS